MLARRTIDKTDRAPVNDVDRLSLRCQLMTLASDQILVHQEFIQLRVTQRNVFDQVVRLKILNTLK